MRDKETRANRSVHETNYRRKNHSEIGVSAGQRGRKANQKRSLRVFHHPVNILLDNKKYVFGKRKMRRIGIRDEQTGNDRLYNFEKIAVQKIDQLRVIII